MPLLSTSDLQPLPLFLHPHLLPPPSQPNFHQLPAGSEQEGGKAGKQGQGKDTGPRGPEAEAERVVWELTKWLGGLFYCG